LLEDDITGGIRTPYAFLETEHIMPTIPSPLTLAELLPPYSFISHLFVWEVAILLVSTGGSGGGSGVIGKFSEKATISASVFKSTYSTLPK
jgi:hypothetical protein